jgi:uncharacterized protein (AIM24 family)
MEYFKHQEETHKPEKPNKFQLANEKTAILNLHDEICFIKVGCMDSYYGTVGFEKTGVTNGGIGNLFKGLITGDTMHLMKATVKGGASIFVSDEDHGLCPTGRSVFVMPLGKETLVINASHVLAFEESVKWEVKVNRSFGGMVQGGLGNVYMTGPGWVAATAFGSVVTHQVSDKMPLRTDPMKTVCWTDGLNVNVKTDLKIGTFFGRSSGEAVQLEFTGNGYVTVQSGHHFIIPQEHHH